MQKLFGLSVVLALVAGCGMWAVGPDYKEPEVKAPDVAMPDAGYPTTNKTATGEFQAAKPEQDDRLVITGSSITNWWAQFNDPVLTDLVDSAISNNLSFLMAQERLVQARWALVGSAAAFLPQISLDGTYTRTWSHKGNYSRDSKGRGTGSNLTANHWNSGFDASWEIDIFGGVRRAYEVADAALGASECTLDDAWVSLTAEIAREYIALRTTQERLRVARTNLKIQSETYDILKSRLDSGIGDELAVNQAKYNVEQTRATIPILLAAEESLMNAIAILSGTMPGSLHSLLAELPARDWLVAPQRLEAISLNAIRNRPDVRASERALAAQVAYVGVAVSQFYPKFYINGSLGFDNARATKFFKADSFLASIGPGFDWPLFRGGNLVANLRSEESKMREAALKYELAVQTACGEVRNAYSAYTQEYHRFQSLQGAVAAARAAVDISNDLYKNGLKDFNNVLDAQRSLLTLEEALTVSRGDISLDLIALYKAMGGGLVLDEEEK